MHELGELSSLRTSLCCLGPRRVDGVSGSSTRGAPNLLDIYCLYIAKTLLPKTDENFFVFAWVLGHLIS